MVKFRNYYITIEHISYIWINDAKTFMTIQCYNAPTIAESNLDPEEVDKFLSHIEIYGR